MTGREFVVELERLGFAIKRRCRTFVWIARGEQTLMLDEEAIIPDNFMATILGSHVRSPPSGRSPSSQTMRRASIRPSGRPSGRPPKSSKRP